MNLPPRFTLLLALAAVLPATPRLRAADQTVPGGGNGEAVALARRSPFVLSAFRFLKSEIETIGDRALREATLDAVANPDTVVAHRVNVDEARKTVLLQQLRDAGLVDPADNATFPGGLRAGVFPPVLNDGSANPRQPQRFESAPGSAFGGHHSQPGGLAQHTAFNTLADLSLADAYRTIYGQENGDGLPELARLTALLPVIPGHGPDTKRLRIRNDIVIAAPVWHDWSKSIVFQWNAHGTEFSELNFGGNGTTDSYGQAGNSKTGGHHLLSLAETMARGLPPDFIIAQACAHSNPTLGNEYKVVNWLRTAAILVGQDPVARGYLTPDARGQLRLPPLHRLGDGVDLNAEGQTNLLVEYTLNNLSDADFTFTIPATAVAQTLLRRLAPTYGYDPVADPAAYNTRYRNPALSYLSAERLTIVYGNRGLAGVQAELDKLRRLGVL